MPVRIPERVLEWRDRQREGSIMSPTTFRGIQRRARAGGYAEPSSVAGKSYWIAVLTKYLDTHPDDQAARRALRAFSARRRPSLRRNILISEELISKQDPEISELLKRLKSSEVTPMQAKLIRRKLRKRGFRLRQHVGGVPRVRVKKPRAPLLLPYYPKGAVEAAGGEITKLRRKPRVPRVIGPPLKRKAPATRAKLITKNWTRPRGTSFITPFDDAADLLELEYSPVEVMRTIMAKWKMTPLEFKNEVVRKMHRDPILREMWSHSLSSENPPKMKVIYDNVLAIEAQKGSESHFPKEKFRHDFKGETKARVIGLPDGSLLIKGKKRLWKEFDY